MSVADIAFLNAASGVTLPPPSRQIHHLELTGRESDRVLLAHYEAVLSRMITTMDDHTNGFRNILLPMILTDTTNSARRALLHGVLALSAFYLGRLRQTLDHKVKAIKYLSQSCKASDADSASRIIQLAACMLLCVYEVFDASEGNWGVHLMGAKSLTLELSRSHSDHPASQESLFLTTWVYYHDTLAGFSNPLLCQHSQSCSQALIPRGHDEGRTAIVGLLGCSLELMDIISAVNHLACHQLTTNESPDSRTLQHLFHRLETIEQKLISPQSLIMNEKLVQQTAELYRLGALLYVHIQFLWTGRTSLELHALVQRSLALITNMSNCTSPWPVFLIALASSQDETQKAAILEIIHRMEQRRRIDNITYMRRMVEQYWKQAELHPDRPMVDWRSMIVDLSFLPSFI
ncbi:fungal-specific transcription factor domain-containing protein [Aspergillus novoparasiticus]|uniref:Fungal-specific transcription factor domain-containing protein n=1 Tax=Aspergillus novoparasiticus TaxID=986946 RepID=A0A5N6EKX8_9EURO|nr:fungal-specific transcription factor domain-containing protein [Aspergillus novoparasiticus]